jgi:hypothetical protein
MSCPDCGARFGTHRSGCVRGAVESISLFWAPLGWIAPVFSALTFLGVLFLWGQVLDVVGKHSPEMAIILGMSGLVIMVLMCGYIKLSFEERGRFVFSRVGAAWAVLVTLLWVLWHMGYVAGKGMKPDAKSATLSLLANLAFMLPVIQIPILIVIGVGIAIFAGSRRAEEGCNPEPFWTRELSKPGKVLTAAFLVLMAVLVGHWTLQTARAVVAAGRVSNEQNHHMNMITKNPSQSGRPLKRSREGSH